MTKWIILLVFIVFTSLSVWTQFGNEALVVHLFSWALAMSFIKITERKK